MKTIKLNYNDSIPNNFTGIIEFPDGTKKWYKEMKHHREDGPAIESPNGTKAWYKEGKCHRENGPAIEYTNGTKFWLKEDKLHRLDGPAIESTTEYKEWHIEGNPYSPKILSKLINSCLFLGKEKGQYDLEWLKFLTEEGIKEFPIMPGMKEDKECKQVFIKLEKIENK
jgi:hypothetical protein